MKIEDLVKLDRYALDEEAEKAAGVLQTSSQNLADARADLLEAETAYKRKCAEVELTIRKNDPRTYGLEKYTEAVISSLITMDMEVQDALDEMNEAQAKVYELSSDVAALNEKCSQIKNLVSLWIGGYYAEPSNKSK